MDAGRRDTARASGRLARGVVAIAFWLAVITPFLALALLLGGLDSGETAAFIALIAVNVVALGVGHRYCHPGPDRSDERR